MGHSYEGIQIQVSIHHGQDTSNYTAVNFSVANEPITMAPASPLLLAWAAVNRTGLTGKVLGPQGEITVEEALGAITIGAAYDRGKEKEMGSIEIRKRANFTFMNIEPKLSTSIAT
jgi:hypothetical protein